MGFFLLQEWTHANNFNVCIASCKQFFHDYEAFMKVQWRYLVLDERQNGNNLTEKHWDAIFNLQRSEAFIQIFLSAFVYQLLPEITSALMTAVSLNFLAVM